MTRLTSPGASGAGYALISQFEQALCVLQEGHAGWRELYAPSRAQEQLRAHGRLDELDVPRQRRLGNVQPPGGTAQAEIFCDGYEVVELPQIQW